MSTERVLLTLATLAFAGVCYALMLKGWRARQGRQVEIPLPPVAPSAPAEVVVEAIRGLFVGTTSATDWLDRIAVHSLSDRATAWLSVASDGVHIAREGLPELYLPYDAITGVGLGEALAGKVIGKDGLVLMSWRLGDGHLTSGFRADDHTVHTVLADAIAARLAVQEAS